MGLDITDGQDWARTPSGKVILRLIEEWEAGITEHGDIALSFTSTVGNAPGLTVGEEHRAAFICSREDARAIAHSLLRASAFSETGQSSAFDKFMNRIKSPALRTVAWEWNEARGSRQMPSWEDVRLEHLSSELGRIWAFDFDPQTESFTGRLAGSAIMTGFRKNFLGTPLRDLHPKHVFERCQANFLRIVTEPACSLWSGKLFRVDDKIFEGERLVLPIGLDGKGVGVLGASDYQDFPMAHSPKTGELMHDRVEWCAL